MADRKDKKTNKKDKSANDYLQNKQPDKAKNVIDTEPTIEEQERIDIEFMVLEGDLSDKEDYSDLLEELFEALSQTQRMKKKQVFRRYKSKIKIARKRAMKRRANKQVIKKRARKQAISNMKKFILKGKSLKGAPASEKNRVERLVKRRNTIVDRNSRRLIIGKKQQERKRFQKSDQDFNGLSLIESFNQIYDSIT